MAKKSKKSKKSKKNNNKKTKKNKEGALTAKPQVLEGTTDLGTAPWQHTGKVKEGQYMLLQDAISYSAQTIPMAGVQFVATNYLKAVNAIGDKYLAGIGINLQQKDTRQFDREIKKALRLFKTYMKVISKTSGDVLKEALKTGQELTKDKELMKRFKLFMDAATEVTKIHMVNLIKLSDDGLPMLEKQADKYITLIEESGESAGKAGINAGLNAMQAVPGLGQALSIIRMIHSATMPFFVFQRKMMNLALKTGNDMLAIAERNQPPALLGIDKTLKVLRLALNAQDQAAKKVVDFTNKTKAKLEGTQKELGKIAEKAGEQVGKQAADIQNRVTNVEQKAAAPAAPAAAAPPGQKTPPAQKSKKKTSKKKTSKKKSKKKKQKGGAKKKSLKKRHRRRMRRKSRRRRR